MFTIEHEAEGTIITLLDTTAENEDLLVLMYDVDKVALAQWDDDHQDYTYISITYDTLRDVVAAMDLPEGMYQREESSDE